MVMLENLHMKLSYLGLILHNGERIQRLDESIIKTEVKHWKSSSLSFVYDSNPALLTVWCLQRECGVELDKFCGMLVDVFLTCLHYRHARVKVRKNQMVYFDKKPMVLKA